MYRTFINACTYMYYFYIYNICDSVHLGLYNKLSVLRTRLIEINTPAPLHEKIETAGSMYKGALRGT